METISMDKKIGWFVGCLVINIILIGCLCMMSNACSEERLIYVNQVFGDY